MKRVRWTWIGVSALLVVGCGGAPPNPATEAGEAAATRDAPTAPEEASEPATAPEEAKGHDAAETSTDDEPLPNEPDADSGDDDTDSGDDDVEDEDD